MAFFQADHLWVNQLAEGVAELVLDVQGSRHNELSPAVLTEMEQALDRIESSGPFRLLLLRTGKSASFCHGLSLNHLAGLSERRAFLTLAEQGQRSMRRFRELAFPSVAIVSGACLGAGLELALACDWRVVVDRPATILGFSEPELGLLPAWGTIRPLLDLVGLEATFGLLLGGRRLHAAQALRLGLADARMLEGEDTPPEFVALPRKRTSRDVGGRSWRRSLLDGNVLGRWLAFRGAGRLLARRLPEGMPGPWVILEALRCARKEGREEFDTRLRDAFADLAASDAFRHLLHLNRHREALRADNVLSDTRERLRRLGIVGSLGRGAALTHLAIARGFAVHLKENDETMLGFALFALLQTFLAEVQRGNLSEPDMRRMMAAVRGTSEWRDFDRLDAVILGGEMDLQTERELLRELETRTAADTVLIATDPQRTVEELQQGLDHPERVALLHFQVPAARSLLVEVVGASNTDPKVLQRLDDLVVALGRTPRRVADRRGFLVLRVLLPYLREAAALAAAGVRPQDLEDALVRFGMLHGPLEHLDLLGIDTAWEMSRLLGVDANDSALAVFAFMKEKGWLGQKTGMGFYRHRKGKNRLHRTLFGMLRGVSAGRKREVPVLGKEDRRTWIRDRLVGLMVRESLDCLAEGVVPTAEDLDLTLALAGWAPHRGGPLAWARRLGKDRLAEMLRGLPETNDPPGMREGRLSLLFE